MIDLRKYRVIDLTRELQPGLLKLGGRYVHGQEVRRLEISQFVYTPDNMLMHWVETETHVGTHVEGPSHYRDELRCVSRLPVEAFMGEAVILDFESLPPVSGKGQPILPMHLQGVKRGDIVLMRSPYEGKGAPYISPEAASALEERGVKMIGIQGVQLEASASSVASHETLLAHDVPVIEGLVNLEKITRERVFYIGLPLRIDGLDSSWIRAVALEES